MRRLLQTLGQRCTLVFQRRTGGFQIYRNAIFRLFGHAYQLLRRLSDAGGRAVPVRCVLGQFGKQSEALLSLWDRRAALTRRTRAAKAARGYILFYRRNGTGTPLCRI